MIPLPFLMYISRQFRGRYAMVFSFLKVVSLLSFVILVAGFFFTDMSINDLFIPTEISAVASLGITFALITGDIQNRKIREYYISAVGIVGFIALALIYVIIYILFPFRGDGGLLLLIGILLMYVTSLMSYLKNFGRT
jgi:peptidoglycan/LPS O-acetylase OafA/YrhL